MREIYQETGAKSNRGKPKKPVQRKGHRSCNHSKPAPYYNTRTYLKRVHMKPPTKRQHKTLSHPPQSSITKILSFSNHLSLLPQNGTFLHVFLVFILPIEIVTADCTSVRVRSLVVGFHVPFAVSGSFKLAAASSECTHKGDVSVHVLCKF